MTTSTRDLAIGNVAKDKNVVEKVQKGLVRRSSDVSDGMELVKNSISFNKSALDTSACGGAHKPSTSNLNIKPPDGIHEVSTKVIFGGSHDDMEEMVDATPHML
jgi:hypothetical protein